MHTILQLKQLKEDMLEELSQFPQYRALKAMEKFINELSDIYGGTTRSNSDELDQRKQISVAVESRIAATPVSAPSPKITPYVPNHRVA